MTYYGLLPVVDGEWSDLEAERGLLRCDFAAQPLHHDVLYQAKAVGKFL